MRVSMRNIKESHRERNRDKGLYNKDVFILIFQ